MSYLQSITGPDFQSGFLYSTTNLSTDNASVINLSVNGLLSMNEFSLITLNLSNLTVPTINVSDLNVSDLNVVHIEAENISAENISVTNEISCDNIIKAEELQSYGDVNVSNLVKSLNLSVTNDATIGNNLSVGYNANVSNLSVRGYGYVRWDLNVSNSVYAQANLNAENSIFAENNITAGGVVTSTGYNFRRTPEDGGLTMATMFADANSLDMTLSYDWNVYKNSTSGTKIMNINYGSSRVNISNLSVTDLTISHDATIEGTLEVTDIDFLANSNGALRAMITTTTNNLSIGSVADIIFENLTNTSPFMIMDVSQNNVNISNLSLDNLSTNLLNNLSAGENISLTTDPITQQIVITGQGGGLNSSNLSLDNLSVSASLTAVVAQLGDLKNTDMTQSLKAGSNISYPFTTNLSVGFDIGTIDTTIMMNPNINLYGIELLPDFYLNPPTFVMNLGRAELTAANISNLSVQTEFTAPVAEITHLTIANGGTFNHDLINSLVVGDNMSIVSVANKPRIGVKRHMNVSSVITENTSVNNISVLESITVGTGGIGGGVYAKNGTGVFSTGGFYLNNAIDGNGGNLNVFWTGGNISAYGIGTLDGHDVRLANGYNTGGLVVDGTLNNINMSNCSITNLSVNVVQSSLTNASVINTEFLNVSGSAGNLYDGLNVYGSTGLQNTSITNLSLNNLTCDLTSNLTAGSNITITSVGGKPVISASGGGGSLPANVSFDNVSISNKLTVVDSIGCQTLGADGNIQSSNSFTLRSDAFTALTQTINGNEFRISTTNSNQDIRLCDATGAGGLLFNAGLNNISIDNLSVANTSILNDMTITRDLKVQRFLDAGKPRFIMCTRTGNIAMSGTSFLATYNTATTSQQNGQFSFTNGGSGIAVNTGGWYRVSWSFGFLRTANTGGDRAQIRSYCQTRPAVGGYSFNAAKNTISSSCYIRRTNQCREGHISGYNFVYIQAGGALNILIQAMVEENSVWNSSLSGISLRGASNLMVEFVSSAPET